LACSAAGRKPFGSPPVGTRADNDESAPLH